MGGVSRIGPWRVWYGGYFVMGAGILSAVAAAKRLRSGVALAAIAAMLSSCSGTHLNDYDTAGDINKEEYAKLLSRRGPEKKPGEASPGAEPPIPGFQSVVAAPSAPELADTRRVSISVTETTSVRDILIELSRRAGVDLEMDPRISGGIIMTATDRPFIEVVDRISELAELRYKMIRNTLRVEIDDPYLEQYRMDVLDVQRSSTSSASTSSDASSVAQALGGGGGGGGGGSNRSVSSVSQTASSNFWETIGKNVEGILGSIQTRRSRQQAAIDASFTPQVSAPATPGADPAAPPAAGRAAGAGGGAGAAALPAQAAALTQNRQQQLDAMLKEDQGGGAAVAAPAQAAQPAAAPVAASRFSLNPQAGIITVFATRRQHMAIERYLRDVRAAVNQQVLIEAKIVEVTLNDQYRAGIDWNAVFGPQGDLRFPATNDNLTIGTNFTREVVPATLADPTFTAAWMNDGDLSLALQLVRQFGTVRTLSSPRLTALNNQVALLKVAQNQVFFDLQVEFQEATQAGQRDRLTVDSQIKTVPIGMILSVQPAIDPISRRISLSMRPSITRVTGYVNDPGVAVTVALAQQANSSAPIVSSPIPIVEVREMDSLVTMESGQTVVMGGLMQEDVQNTREGLPGFMDIPVLGKAVSQDIKQNKVTELVVFIRATLANAPETISDEDIRLYKTFTPDPRPIVF
ncbi:MAG: type II secretion system protein GspD [Rhodospirillaceae bacterium]